MRRRVERDGFSLRATARKSAANWCPRGCARRSSTRITVSDQEVDLALGIAPVPAPALLQPRRAEYRLAHILVGLPEGADAAQIEAAQAKADALVAELRKGADFARPRPRCPMPVMRSTAARSAGASAAQLPPAFAEAIGSMSAG